MMSILSKIPSVVAFTMPLNISEGCDTPELKQSHRDQGKWPMNVAF